MKLNRKHGLFVAANYESRVPVLLVLVRVDGWMDGWMAEIEVKSSYICILKVDIVAVDNKYNDAPISE